MDGFGGVVTFEVEADFDATCRFVDACRIPYIAPSLGGVETLIEMPALMSFWDQTPEERHPRRAQYDAPLRKGRRLSWREAPGAWGLALCVYGGYHAACSRWSA